METHFFFLKSSKFEFWLLTKSWNHLSFVNISLALVIDTSMERFSRVLHHGNQRIWLFFQKVWNWIWLLFWLVLKSWNQHSSRSQHAPICRHRGPGMHRRPFEGWYLVMYMEVLWLRIFQVITNTNIWNCDWTNLIFFIYFISFRMFIKWMNVIYFQLSCY